MKRIVTLMLAMALVAGAAFNAAAVDVNVSGGMWMIYNWTDNEDFNDGDADGNNEDDFAAVQRVRTQIDFVANENLSGVVYFEINNIWGQAGTGGSKDSGGAVGTDAVNVQTRRAFIDFKVPGTELDIRAGLQGLALPSEVTGSNIFDDDVAAMLVSYKFNDMFDVQAFWARPYANDSASAFNSEKGTGDGADELDMFGIIAGVHLDGIELIPFATYAKIGGNAAIVSTLTSIVGSKLLEDGDNQGRSSQIFRSSGDFGNGGGVAYFNGTDAEMDAIEEGADAFWLGLSASVDMFDPITIKFDANYGKVNYGDANYLLTARNNTGGVNATHTKNASNDEILDRAGWMVAAKVSFNMDMMTPGVIAWYSTGEDDDIENGSERMPSISAAANPTSFGFDGGFSRSASTAFGTDIAGTMAVGLLLEDIKLIDDLTSVVRLVYYKGTNDADFVTKYDLDDELILKTSDSLFLTDEDSAWEVNFDHKYSIYENLTLSAELGYIKLDLDEDTWDLNGANAADYDDAAWKLSFGLGYTF